MAVRGSVRPHGFRLFLTGQAVSYFGDHLYLFAVVWWALLEADSVSAATAVVLVAAVAAALLAPAAGAVIDRIDRVRLLIGVNVTYTAVTLFTGLLMVTGSLSWPVLLVLAFLVAALDQVSMPAAATLPPALVPTERLRAANGAVETWKALTGIAAPVVAGLLAPTAPAVGWLLIADAATFLVNGVCLLLLRRQLGDRPEAPAAAPTIVTVAAGLRGQLRPVLRVFADNRALLRVLVVTTVANILMAPVGVLAADAMRPSGATAAGIAMSCFAAGVLAAAQGVRFLPTLRDGPMLVLGLAAVAVGDLVFGLAPVVAVACLGSFLGGAGTVVTIVASRTWFQREVPAEIQGRVFSLRFGLTMLVRPIGLVGGGVVAGVVGSSWTVAGIGALTGLLAVAAVFGVLGADGEAAPRAPSL